MKAIEILGISKRFRRQPALHEVSFEVEPGDAVGLIGANGAGKTTLLRILATLLKPDAGFARVMGMDGRFQAPAIRRVLAFMPDAVAMEEDLTVGEYLDFFAGLHGMTGQARRACVKGLVDLLDLGEVQSQGCGSLSRGMQQRVGLARTLVHDPRILLLDEPAANLDPRARIDIREVLKELRRMGKTVIISSHILRELGDFCNKIALMDRGKLAFFGTIADLSARVRTGRVVAVRVEPDPSKLAAALESDPAVEAVAADDGWLRVKLKSDATDGSFIARRAVDLQLNVRGLREEEPDLEEIFLRLTGGKGAS